MNIVFILFGLTLLVIGGEFLVRSSVAISLKFHLSRMVIGLTVVSFATSAPELFVSVQAALDGYPFIAYCKYWFGFRGNCYYLSIIFR
jgi:cation:H+ antiporter